MCEKCKPIDERIERYQRLVKNINDQQTIDGVTRLIDELEKQKKTLHPED
jgi:hypothetical protein